MKDPEMNDDALPAPEGEEPIADFSRCHQGIITRLDQLGELPPLVEAAARARHSAAELVRFFDDVIERHHRDEERELFPAVLRSAAPGEEADRVRALVDRLNAEHLSLESQWARLRPHLKKVSRGEEALLDAGAVRRVVAEYKTHARLEEDELLPLASHILARTSGELAALGMALHLRRSKKHRLGAI